MIVKNANLITMKEDSILYGYDMLIEEGVIKKIAANIETGTEPHLDCTGKYIIPGLFDSHVHFDTPTTPTLLLANGVTSARNMWGRPDILDLKKAIDSGEADGPSIYSTGPIIDGSSSELKGSVAADTPGDARAAVRASIEAGYDFLKTYPDIPRDAFFALMEEAANVGISVVGHGNWHVSFDELVKSGYYSIEHASCLPTNDEMITEIAHLGIWFTPTLITLQNMVKFVNDDKDAKEIFPKEYIKYVDMVTLEHWNNDIERCRKTPRFRSFKMEEFYRRTRIFAANSDRLLLGSDAPMPGTVAGFSIHCELANLVEFVGLTPYQALAAGTVRPASCMKIADRKGTIEEDKDADLLILNSNPLSNIRNSSEIYAVMKSERLYDRKRLDDMLLSAQAS